VTDSTIDKLVKECKSMESLDLSQCVMLTEAAIFSISQNCSKLKTFKIAYCVKAMTDDSLAKFCKGCPIVSVIDISYCKAITDIGMEGFLQNKLKFTRIQMNGLEELTSLGVNAVLKNSSSCLQYLEMGLLDPVFLRLNSQK